MCNTVIRGQGRKGDRPSLPLVSLFQNNRRYVISRSDTQLVNKPSPDTSACTPQLNYADNSSLTINPCGLTAWTFFNDSYSVRLTNLGHA